MNLDRPLLSDTHVHFHDLRLEDVGYAWLTPGGFDDVMLGDHEAIRAERYWADDYLAETRFQRVGKVVHVNAADSATAIAETRWIQAFHDRLGVPHGAIAHADLADPEMDRVLAAQVEHPVVRGVRDLREDDYLHDEKWAAGFARLGEMRLVCCAAPAVEDYGQAARVAARHPGTTFCLDHAGLPLRRDREYFEWWRAELARLAAVPSVVIKVSGLGMADHRWTLDSLRPWVETAIELFGPDRCCLGSNWPVDRLYSSYGDVVDAFDRILSNCSGEERLAIFSGTADRVFRL